MGYTKDVIKGLSWGTSLDLLGKGTSVIKIAILSRIFDPVQFGIFGIGVLVLGFLELITDTGTNIFLVQEDEDVSHYLDMAWIVSIGRGILIAILLAVFSSSIAMFFKTPEAASVILAISLVPLIRGFINPAIVSLQKNLKFKEDSIFRFVVSGTEDFTTIILALATGSVFSLVWGMLFGVVVEVAMTFIFIKPRPKFSFESIKFRKIIGRGKWITAASVFDYLFEHADDFTVGKLLGTYSLGIYRQAYAISIIPATAVSQRLGRITFPIYVKITAEKERVKKAFYKTLFSLSLIVIPFGIALFLLSDPVVRIVLGEKWLAAIPVLKVLALFGVIRAITALTYPLFFAYKKQEYVSIVTLVSIVVLGALILPLTAQLGLIGAGVSALLGSLAALPVSFYYLNKIFKSTE